MAPDENVLALREGLAEHFESDAFLSSESMALLVRENLHQIHRVEKSGQR